VLTLLVAFLFSSDAIDTCGVNFYYAGVIIEIVTILENSQNSFFYCISDFFDNLQFITDEKTSLKSLIN